MKQTVYNHVYHYGGPDPSLVIVTNQGICGVEGKGGFAIASMVSFLFYFVFVNVSLTDFGNVTIAVKLNKVSFVSKDCLIVTEQLFL